MENKKFLSYKELHRWLNLPMGTLYALVHRKKIPHIRLGGRLVRFNTIEIEKWLNQSTSSYQKEKNQSSKIEKLKKIKIISKKERSLP